MGDPFVPKQLFDVAFGGGSNLHAATQVLPADVVKYGVLRGT